MPGKNRPESFTPASRSKNDSMRSPTTAETLKITPNTAWSGVIPARQSPNSAAKPSEPVIEITIAPTQDTPRSGRPHRVPEEHSLGQVRPLQTIASDVLAGVVLV